MTSKQAATIPIIRGSYFQIMVGLLKTAMNAADISSNNPGLVACVLMDRSMAQADHKVKARPVKLNKAMDDISKFFAILSNAKNANRNFDDNFTTKHKKLSDTVEALRAEQETLKKAFKDILPKFKDSMSELLATIRSEQHLKMIKANAAKTKGMVRPLIDRIEIYLENQDKLVEEAQTIREELITRMRNAQLHQELAKAITHTLEDEHKPNI